MNKKILIIVIILLVLIISILIGIKLFNRDENFKIITYEQLKQKISKGEEFLVYCGRDTCGSCHANYPILQKVVAENKLKVPIYYFDTQLYKDLIDRKEENSEEIWSDIKENLGFEFIPYIAYYKKSNKISEYDYPSIPYYGDTEEDLKREKDERYDSIKNWLEKEKIIKK